MGGKIKDNNYSTLTLSAIYLVFHLNLSACGEANRFKEWDGVGGKIKDNNYSTLTLSAIYLVFHLNLNT